MNTATRFLIHVVLPTAIGACIYIGWRSQDLFVFRWIEYCGLTSFAFRFTLPLPNWLLYSLPDGCWVYAATSWMILIWNRQNAWTMLAVALAVGAEVGQYFGIVQGTYDTIDILFYLGAFILAGILNEKAYVVSTGDDRDGVLSNWQC